MAAQAAPRGQPREGVTVGTGRVFLGEGVPLLPCALTSQHTFCSLCPGYW